MTTADERWAEYEALQRRPEIDRLTSRFGEWYRIWYEGRLFWAEGSGDKLSADSATGLTLLIADHMALCRQEGRLQNLDQVIRDSLRRQ